MIAELALATMMVVLTVAIHALGIMGLLKLLNIEIHSEELRHVKPGSLRGIATTMALVVGLIGLHGIEIWAYAGLYLHLGAVEGVRTAVYFSTMTYSTLGYSDEFVHNRWQVLAAIESINGVILMGWSTAFFVTVQNELLRRR